LDNRRQKQRRKVRRHKLNARQCIGPKHIQKQTDRAVWDFSTLKIHGRRVARGRATDNGGVQWEISGGSTELEKTDQTNGSAL